MGILPFRGYDFVPLRTPTRYILYYNRHNTTTLDEGPGDKPGRAYSTDLKTWTTDDGDICATSGELCVNGSLRNAGVLPLADGRYRMFIHDRDLVSAISSDGVTWRRETGVRFTADPTSIFERGSFLLAFASFVTLPDATVRMYYMGGIVPGSTGTPAYYNQDETFNGNLLKWTGIVLSATSKDGGLTWTRDPGVRLNPLVQGPARVVRGFDQKIRTEVDLSDFTAVAVREHNRTVYRIYGSTWGAGTVSYVSSDGLSFVLEGQVPADRGDPKALVLPDGRTWLITNQYPDAINDTIVYGPQSLVLNSTRAFVTLPPNAAIPVPFQSTRMISAVSEATRRTTGGERRCAQRRVAFDSAD